MEGEDLLGGAAWSCVSNPPGEHSGPPDLTGPELRWIDATVPGTVAEALRAVGADDPSPTRLDGKDWWFRCRFAGPGEPVPDGWLLELGGLATLADVWLNGTHLLHSESMFASHRIPVAGLAPDNELCLRFAALTPVLAQKRPRPRWKTTGVSSQNLRWIRTTLLGRQAGWAVLPAPVGPWRPISLRPVRPVEVVASRALASCGPGDDDGVPGIVAVTLELSGSGVVPDPSGVTARVEVAGATAPLEVVVEEGRVMVTGEVRVDAVDRWWPHTHGDQPLYPVEVVIADQRIDLGSVGFRTVEVDRTTGGFDVSVNGHPVFCRGAGWYPIDPVGLQATDEDLESTLSSAQAAGMNMLRIPGGTVYEDDRFFRACDRLGILVWQDIMLGMVDPPDAQEFLDAVREEAVEVLDAAARHPSLAVVCGGQQLEEQPAMFGLSRDRWHSPVIHELLPGVVANLYPGLPYVSSSPSGGDLPFQTDAGVSHFYSVGVYLFPPEELRRSAPRFASAALAFAVPPERQTVDEEFGGDLSHHESDWKRGVHRDAGSWFDLEDVRDHYAAELFGEDIATLWRFDHERALDLGRAAIAELVGAAIAEWRRPGSPCSGFLGEALRDMRPGPGWGLIDSSGRPKAPWYTLARGSAPVAVLMTGEGVNGLDIHLVNDTARAVDGTLAVSLHTSSHPVEVVTHDLAVPARGGLSVHADALFDGFRDLTYAYRFGPRPFELVTADLLDGSGEVLASAGYLPGGPARDVDPDVGLQARIEPADEGMWLLEISTRRMAEYVQVDVPGFVATDSWFHLPPGASRTTILRPEPGPPREPRGRVGP